MNKKAETRIAAARVAAARLEQLGEHKLANDVRALCCSHSASVSLNSQKSLELQNLRGTKGGAKHAQAGAASGVAMGEME
jgi:hypothetical protein